MTPQEIYEATIRFLGDKKRAYQLTFAKNQPHAQFVIRDLVMAAHMNEDCPHTDPFNIGEWMGAQKIVRRIQRYSNLSPEDLFALYSGVRTTTKEKTS